VDEAALPDDVDPEMWFRSTRTECDGGRDYLWNGEWHTFPGRMAAYCPHRPEHSDYRISLSELPDDLPVATRYWVRGFLAGNLPDPEEDWEWETAEMSDWRRRAREFTRTGRWTPLADDLENPTTSGR
jgi:hypothetical protein